MKTFKRIFAVILLILMVLFIGYLLFTSNRLTAIDTENLTIFGGTLCQGKIGTILPLV